MPGSPRPERHSGTGRFVSLWLEGVRANRSAVGARLASTMLTIHWPGGGAQVLGGLATDAFYRVVEGRAPERYVPGAAVLPP